MEWTKQNMGGWNLYRSGPYTIEKDDTRIYCLWYDNEEIAVVTSVALAKAAAARHAKETDQ